MQFLDLLKELNKFMQGEVSLSVIKDCFPLYWNRVYEKDDPVNNIAKAEILQVAVSAFELGEFSKEDLREIIYHYSSEINHQRHEVNEERTKSHE